MVGSPGAQTRVSQIMSAPRPNIAYVLLHFPFLTETFIAEEIWGLKKRGDDVSIVSLLGPGPGPPQPLSQELLSCTWYAPGLLSINLWMANLYFLVKSPGQYGYLLVSLLQQPSRHRSGVLLAKRLLIFLKAVAVAYHLKDSEVQLVHSHFAWLSGAGAWICSALLGLPFTMTVHAYDLYASSELLPLLAGQANHVVAISSDGRQQVRSAVNGSELNISVIHCGVKAPPNQAVNMGGSVGSNNDPIKLLSVGSLVPKKGHTFLIDACHLLDNQGLAFTCTIIGSGPERAALERSIRGYDLQNKVTIVDAQPHPKIIEAYSQHDMFVLASVEAPSGDRDGIPVVLMEAGGSGLPLISTRISGIPELVINDQTGLLVPPGDASALAQAITILADNPMLRSKFGENARNLVQSEFNIEKSVQKLSAMFHDTYAESQTSHMNPQLGKSHGSTSR